MSRAYLCIVVLTCSFAGCAGNRQNQAVASLAATAPAATAEAAPTANAVAPVVVDGNQLAARSAATPICRDVLRRGSNVHVRECRTAEQWKLYERREAQAAGELVRQMQRGVPDDPNANRFPRR